ncbi:MAG: SpoVA/SpoVAEb family sporulation membrane protein [Erysipelotrichales bacterium]|nr:SpoVA/SpoVAEb family sporulation membrane protein [Erysipelotrichales bacterium]
MIIKSFIFSGIVCLIAQIIKDNTKLTSGHITSIFVSVGAFLGFLGIYDKLVKCFGGGASVVIMSFGNTLYNGAVELGILNMLANVSVGIITSVLMAFIITLIFKVKN